MSTFNHTRGDSPRTPCPQCAVGCGWHRYAHSDMLRCPKCGSNVSAGWLLSASERGEEHVCVAAALADEQLRAECERRGIHVYPHDAHPTSMAAAWRERDEWKAKAQALEAGGVRAFSCDGCDSLKLKLQGERAERQGKVSQLMGELDAMRKRAEAAEANCSIKAISVPNRILTAEEKAALEREYVGVVKRFFDGPLPETIPVAIDNSYVIPRKRLKRSGPGAGLEASKVLDAMTRRALDEAGPGIALLPEPRPDNSVAHLDEDLLADDG